jgi:hypothetical protein
MKTGICSAIAAAAFIVLAGNASADEPAQLSDTQMDGVSAAGIAMAQAGASSAGDLLSETVAATQTLVDNSILATAQAESIGLAASLVFPGESTSQSQAAAALP